MKADIGVVGLGVMGASLARNIESHGFAVAVHNRTAATTEAFLRGPGRGGRFVGAESLAALAAAVAPPRRVLVMVPAGAPVDAVLEDLGPHLDAGDIVIDGGNSHYRDTERRFAALDGIRFCGMGVSGGQEGALRGPSLMPGCEPQTYAALEPVLARIAAATDSGPCVTHVGGRSAGHFVKMVHNGIEYADMQLIAEAYDLLRHGLGLEPERIAALFGIWNDGELQSFLVEITSRIVAFPDERGGGFLLDRIVDEAGQKGTGRWTVEAALELGVPVPSLAAAVDARIVSGLRELRAAARARFGGRVLGLGARSLADDVRAALYAAKICAYAQGFDLLRRASDEMRYGLRLHELARIWKAGCIIRAAFLDDIRRAFQADAELPSLLLDPTLAAAVESRLERWRRTVREAAGLGIPVPALAASLAYFDACRRDALPANLIQAQRDYFGAHTYRRRDADGPFHSEWTP